MQAGECKSFLAFLAQVWNLYLCTSLQQREDTAFSLTYLERKRKVFADLRGIVITSLLDQNLARLRL